MVVHCTHCLGAELDHVNHKGTHIYVCQECPNVTFEFPTQFDIKNFADYLNEHKEKKNGGDEKMNNDTHEQKALLFAERYGIIDYKVVKNLMIYNEVFPTGTWKCTVDLYTMKEVRKQIKGGK